ncbi:hypothetical protein [Clostridium magnum]|uniref:Uncharacterized protein n=1 Tax=Clostridium magnum DSM 2767 TaxID=1121326 RepID=A0A162TSC6_9CLOT|nr:hypothetical protein [Clostridium magnum]KZL92995.1 hypothetical protein CLMAG_28090 [Clostridium magnum DSM 2767]SHJ22822.1 hypothetical protein SAMN02745944_05578 [Clostridium magnum DSM 2767]
MEIKRTLSYILVFFGICYLLGNFSANMTQKIYFSYIPDLVNELKERLDQNETLYLDGQMLQAYVISTGEELAFENRTVKWNNLDALSSSKNSKYKVVKESNKVSVTSIDEMNKTSLSAIKSFDIVILIKNIAVIVVGIAIAIAMYKIYFSRKGMPATTPKVVNP